MADDTTLTPENLRARLSDAESISADSFTLLQDICRFASLHEDEEAVQEMVLRALEHRDRFGDYGVIVDSLVRQVGLFPYLDPNDLSVADQIAYELHRPAQMEENIVFHRPQADVYWALLSGENVVLSAPTSFGKSLIIDAAIASGRYSNVLIVVPTIALIDETRRRLSCRFGDEFRVITQPSQAAGERNIYVMTQERAIKLEVAGTIDLLVVDEFYKLDPRDSDGGRAHLLNQVLYKYAKSAGQFYMLGPNISGFSPEFGQQFRPREFEEEYRTVVSELHEVDAGDDPDGHLVELCKSLTDPTIIFCSSPKRAAAVAKILSSDGLGEAPDTCQQAADWMAAHYHPEWHVVDAMRHGIGVHHGRIPRALAHFAVRAFDSGELPFLVCTSTLIEGVNTKAKNIIILDNKINKKLIDLFTFNNICGRSGRMGKHFIGHVYLFDPARTDDLMFVDIPAFSQDDEAPESLLIQLEEEDLTPKSRQRIAHLKSQDLLAYSTLKANVGIDTEMQLAVARELHDDLGSWLPFLQWDGMPTWEQVLRISNLFWSHFDGRGLASGSVLTALQLAVLISKLKRKPTMAELIEQQIPYCGNSADAAVQSILDFVRLWARFHFPRLLRALDLIQSDVLPRYRKDPGDYEAFAVTVENLFLPPGIVALDEYGVDLEMGRKLIPRLGSDDDLDETLIKLAELDPEQMGLSPFEVDLIRDAQSAL